MSCRNLMLWFCVLVGIGWFSSIGQSQNFYVKSSDQHWVYEAMACILQEGYLRNYPQAWIQSGHELSRFEIAYYIKQFVESYSQLKRKDKTQLSVQTVTFLCKLMVEFEGELTALGVKTTDLNKISPNLIPPFQNYRPNDYQDIDAVLHPFGGEKTLKACYYFGQYYHAYQNRSFIFLPAENLSSSDFELLEGNFEDVNIVYQVNMGEKQLFLVVKGNLPLTDKKLLNGYFLFPLTNTNSNGTLLMLSLSQRVMALFEEVNQLQQIGNLWRLEGSMPLKEYSKLENKIKKSILYDNFQQGVKIGSALLFSETPTLRTRNASNQFGLPMYSPQPDRESDIKPYSQNTPDTYRINIQGRMSLNKQTSVFGGIDLLYTETRKTTLFEDLLSPQAKYSAGVDFQVNDYWTLMSYQSFVDYTSKEKSEVLSTTSLGVEYNDWVTLWLAYQMLDFKSDQKLTGVISIRF